MGGMPLGTGGEIRSPARLGRDTADRLVNALRRKVNRRNDPGRPVHRVGIVATGTFHPNLDTNRSGELAHLTDAPYLTGDPSSATVRFSNFLTDHWGFGPDIRGMACRLVGEDGEGPELDLVAMSIPRFLVRREEDFHALPNFDKVAGAIGGFAKLLLTRRTTAMAILAFLRFTWLPGLIGHRPRQLADESYFGVHTFWLRKGDVARGMRYHWRPLSSARVGRANLDEGLRAQFTNHGRVSFELIVDVLDDDPPYRKTNDPLRRWPAWPREWPRIWRTKRWFGTERFVAGTLLLDTFHDSHDAHERWVFNPVPAVDGLEPSDDEILQARGNAYVASHVRRLSS